MIEVFEHSPLANDVADAFGSYHWWEVFVSNCSLGNTCPQASDMLHTFIFADVLQSKGQTCILSLDDPHFAKCAFAHHAQESEVVEVDYGDTGIVSQYPLLEEVDVTLRDGQDAGASGSCNLRSLIFLQNKGGGGRNLEGGNVSWSSSPSSVKTTGLPLVLPIVFSQWCSEVQGYPMHRLGSSSYADLGVRSRKRDVLLQRYLECTAGPLPPCLQRDRSIHIPPV